jgi:glutamyl-Q tRNA(Asp) synthetase
LRAEDRTITVEDGLQAPFTQNIERDVGDFVIRRADNIIAYHLAVVIDDGWQNVTEVVRGADLLDSTPRQIFLQTLLGLPTPRYVHLPLAIGRDGGKLSKQNGASPIDIARPARALVDALAFLGQAPPHGLETSTPSTVLQWAMESWSLARVPRSVSPTDENGASQGKLR